MLLDGDIMVFLVDGDSRFLDEYKEAYTMSLEKIKNGCMSSHDLMFDNLDEVDIIQNMKDHKDVTKLKPGYVIAYDYFLVDDDKFIGVVSIRKELTSHLLQYGGNISYAIHPKYWNQGYGNVSLKLALDKAREMGLRKVLITCDDNNVASYKIIEKNGGILENKVFNTDNGESFLTRRYWITL